MPCAVQDGVPGPLSAYRGTVHALKSIVKEEGWRALYSGLAPGLLGAGKIATCKQRVGAVGAITTSMHDCLQECLGAFTFQHTTVLKSATRNQVARQN